MADYNFLQKFIEDKNPTPPMYLIWMLWLYM